MASSRDRFVELVRVVLQAKLAEHKTDWVVTVKGEEYKVNGRKRLTVSLEASNRKYW